MAEPAERRADVPRAIDWHRNGRTTQDVANISRDVNIQLQLTELQKSLPECRLMAENQWHFASRKAFAGGAFSCGLGEPVASVSPLTRAD